MNLTKINTLKVDNTTETISGIVNLHPYIIVDFFEFYDHNNKLTRLVRLRNALGIVEYYGSWGPNSPELMYKENINKLIQIQKDIP